MKDGLRPPSMLLGEDLNSRRPLLDVIYMLLRKNAKNCAIF